MHIAKDQLKMIKSITFDYVHDVFYFTDFTQPKIYTLKLRDSNSFVIKELVDIERANIQDIVYDFHDDALYWSNYNSGKIMRIKNLQRNKTIEVFYEIEEVIAGLEIDTCNRNLYFTTTSGDNPSINVISINDKSKIRSFGEDHYNPIAITLDHQNRRLYVADAKRHSSYSIDSYDSNGNDYRNEISNTYNIPRSIAVDKEYVYYVEGEYSTLRRFSKKVEAKKTSNTTVKFPKTPNDIIVRSNFMVDVNQKNCKFNPSNIKKVKNEIESSKSKVVTETPIKNCLHGGSLDKKSSNCICKENFDGEFCEINLCYNFCLNNGVCTMEKSLLTQKLEPHCSCENGFIGKHCEIDVCNNFCLNSGKCLVDRQKQPICECKSDFAGARCEIFKVIDVPSTTITIIESINSTTSIPINMPYEKTIEDLIPNCPSLESDKNAEVYIYIGMGILILSLLMVVILTILLIKRKVALKPKPHKKYVIHKKMDNLTYRPTTEQCEVVIEDCCNMNICETVNYNLFFT